MPSDIREKIIELIDQAESAIPNELVPDLLPGQHTGGQPEFHPFEHSIWKNGEDIRQLILQKKSLRNDEELQGLFLCIGVNPNAKRGRQTFISLLGYKSCSPHACEIASQLNDRQVAGQVISTLLKMQTPDFVKEVSDYLDADRAWIRNKAKVYCARYGKLP